MENFKDKLADIFEVKTLSNDDIIKDFDEWDSLTLLSIIALVDSEFNVQLNASSFDKIITIGDLISYVNSSK
jgi:acyl carrier protein